MRATKKIGLGSLGAISAAALVLGLTSSPAMAAVSPTFGGVVLSGPSSTTAGTKAVPLTLQFNGPAPTSNIYYKVDGSARIIGYNSKIRSSYLKNVQGVYADSGAPTPAAAKGVKWNVYDLSTSPGKWRVSTAVTKRQWNGSTYVNTVASGYKDISINASKSYSKRNTSLSGYGRANRAFPLTVRAPYYQVGAKVRVYYKAKGKKKYKKVATGTLKSGDAYFSKTKIKIRASKLARSGRLYVKIGSRPYAPAYNSAVGKLRRY